MTIELEIYIKKLEKQIEAVTERAEAAEADAVKIDPIVEGAERIVWRGQKYVLLSAAEATFKSLDADRDLYAEQRARAERKLEAVTAEMDNWTDILLKSQQELAASVARVERLTEALNNISKNHSITVFIREIADTALKETK